MTTQPGSSAEDAETGAGHEPSSAASALPSHDSRHSPLSVAPHLSSSSAPISAHTPEAASPLSLAQPQTASLVAHDVPSSNHAPAQSSVAQSTAAISADSAATSTSGAATLDDLAQSRKRKRSPCPPSVSTLAAPPSTPSSSSAQPVPVTVAHLTPPLQPADQVVTNGTGAADTSFNVEFAAASAAPTAISFGFGGSSIAPLVHASASSIAADAAAERQRLSVSVPRSDLAADPATAPQSLISSASTDSILIASAPPAKRMNRSRTPPAAAITSATTDSAPAPAPAPAPAASAFLPSPSPSSFNTTSPTLVPVPIAATTSVSTQPPTHPSAATRTRIDGTASAPSGSVPMSPAAPAAALSDTPAARSDAAAVPIAGETVHESEKRSPSANHADDAQQGRPLDGAAPISDPSASSSAPAPAPAPAAPAESSVLDRSSAASAADAHPDSCDASNFQIPRARSPPSTPAAAAETHSAGASSQSPDDAVQNSDLAPLRQNSISVNIPPSSPRLAEGGGVSDGVDLAKSDLRSDASTSDPLIDSIAPATNDTTLTSPLSRAAADLQGVDPLEPGADLHTGLTALHTGLTASTAASSSSNTLSKPSATEQDGGAGQAASPSLTAASSVQDPAPPSQPASEAASELQTDAPSKIHVEVESADEPTPGKGSISLAPSTAVASEQSTPSAQTPRPTSTISTLQLASEALSSIPDRGSRSDANVTSAAAELLTALHQRSKKASAIRSPHPGSVRSRSAATTPVPPSLLLGLKHPSLDVTAQSSRATTPTRTPSGRSKRRRRERNAAATPTAAVLALPSIDASDRRRSARVAKAVTATASDSSSAPNLALFGFSPYLENLVMNAKETERRTRSGGRTVRPPADRAPARGKRSAAKNKAKEADPDGPDDEAKSELYRQLCILSYQLQADLDMVPAQSLDQLRARFASPPPADKVDDSQHTAPGLEASATRPDALKPAAPGYDQPQLSGAPESVAYDTIVKTEPPQSPQLTHAAPSHARPPFSPESSPEIALMDTARATYGSTPSYISASYAQGAYPSYGNQQPYSWGHKAESIEDEPMSPVPRPARSNIMSISALMSGPSPQARSPTPPRISAASPVPSFMQAWTDDDEMASQILQACAAAIPKLHTTELDRLTKIAQLAAFDLPAPWIEETGEDDNSEAERAYRERYERFSKFAPSRLNPLETLNTEELYAREEAEYLDEMQASGELYESIRYLSNFDDIVDEWRAGELSRLRLQLEMRKAEIERIWTCDRKLAWSSFIDARAGPLYREAAFKARHARWQAEMELDLLAVHRRKTRGYAKLTHNIWAPPQTGSVEDPDSVALYKKFGRFLSASRYAEADDPLVRADLRKMQKVWQEHKRRTRKSERAQQEEIDEADRPTSEAALSGDEAANDAAMSIESSEASDWDEEYDSDSSYISSESGISSLPSFSSVCSSPRRPSVVDIDVVISDADGLVSEAVSLLGAYSDSDGDADESLWARQLRLANQSAASKEATDVSAAASGLQTPAEVGDGARSMVSSRAPSPALSSKLDQDQQRDRKRKRKKPPPPGARLWKKGRVQQDPPDEPVEETEPLSMQASKSQQGEGRHAESDRMRSSPKQASALGFDAPQARDFVPNSFHDMRDDPRSNMLATPSYAGYGARTGYGAAREFDYDRERALHDPYAHPSYPVYQHGYPAFQQPPMPRYSEDAPMADARYAYPRVTPPREMQHDARYAYPYPPPPRAAAYPSANPPPPHPPSQWRY